MVAAICYAWLLQNREEEDVAVIPVVNIERGRMNKHEEAAWLLFHVGIDASALLFADEVLDLLFLYSITCVLPNITYHVCWCQSSYWSLHGSMMHDKFDISSVINAEVTCLRPHYSFVCLYLQ